MFGQRGGVTERAGQPRRRRVGFRTDDTRDMQFISATQRQIPHFFFIFHAAPNAIAVRIGVIIAGGEHLERDAARIFVIYCARRDVDRVLFHHGAQNFINLVAVYQTQRIERKIGNLVVFVKYQHDLVGADRPFTVNKVVFIVNHVRDQPAVFITAGHQLLPQVITGYPRPHASALTRPRRRF